MVDEVNTPEVKPVTEESVDLKNGPKDTSEASTDEGFKASAVEHATAPETPPAQESEAPTPEAEGEAPATEEVSESTAPEGPEAWGDTGSEAGNDVLGMLQESGISTADAKSLLFDAVQSGDLTKIDRAALEEKVGKHAANIILRGTETFVKEQQIKVDTIIADVHTAAGGSEQWGKVSAWASKNIQEAELAEYRPMIDKGGASARFAVAEIMGRYNADANNTTLTINNSRAEATSVSPPASTAITRAEYVAALEKAHRRGASHKELAEIQAQRNAGRKQGI